MTATIVDGKGLADAALINSKAQLDALPEPLHLVAVCVGDDPGLKAFVNIKQKVAQSIGVTFSSYFFEEKDAADVKDTLKFLAADESVHGIFIELPLPQGFDTKDYISLIPSEKDVDALGSQAFVPEPAVVALQYVLTECDLHVSGKRVAVVGQGNLVGRPISRWLREQGAQVIAIDEHTPNASAESSAADIVITGVGKAGLVTADWIKEGAVVIDYGYAKQNNLPTGQAGAYIGDVDFESVSKKAGLLTPVPGGMGPLVVAAVMENLVTLATR